MSLRLHIGGAVSVVLAGLVVTLAAIIWAFSVKSVSEAEVRAAERDLARAERNLQNALSTTQTFVHDWAFWDETYDFVEARSATYRDENLGAYVFETFDIDALLITDLEAQPVYAEAYDAALEDAVPLDEVTLEALLKMPNLFSTPDAEVDLAGYLYLPKGAAQVVSAPVSDEVSGAVNGAFLAVRYLDDALMEQLTADTLVNAELLWGEAATASAETPAEIGGNDIRLSAALPSLTADVPIKVAINHPRALYRSSARGAGALLALLITVSLAFGVLTLVFVERLLLSRLTRLSRWVEQITRKGDLGGRIEIEGVDEIAQLGGYINGMLEALQTTFCQLTQSERRYSLVAEGVNDGLWDWDLGSGEVLYSSRWFELLGFDEGERVGTTDTWQVRVHPDDEPRVRRKLEEHIAGRSEFFEDEHRLRTKGGDYLWVLVRGKSVCNAAGVPERVAGSLTDISMRGVFDPLTGLPNRLMLQARLEQLFECGGGESVSLLFMDVNRFKLVNDSLGHKVGDLLLREIAARLQSCVRGDDLVARLGGDEFVVLLNGTSAESLEAAVARLERRIAEPFDLAGETLFPSLSIGLVKDVLGCAGPDTALENADVAMYEAKRSGAPHLYYDEQMLAAAVAAHRLETDLRYALERGDFYLDYQPIVALGSGAVVGAEALLRWRHPERGFVSPAEFIPATEDSGLIVPLGLWVLKEACSALAAHPELGDAFTMSVNLSAKQLLHPHLVSDVRAVLLETGVDPAQLKLEITETAVIESTGGARAPLEELKALGVKIVMDDFGTGYSSLTYIQDLPIDTLKVDRAFIQKMGEDRRTLEIVRTIVSLAEALSLDLVAEGIEHARELEVLRGFGCPYGQGYLFSKPTTLGEVVRLTLAETPQLVRAGKPAERVA